MNKLIELLPSIKAVGFDLDDTLWDNRQTIIDAVNAQNEALVKQGLEQEHIAVVYKEHLDKTVSQEPELQSDVSALRLRVLESIANEHGWEASIAGNIYQAFYEARQNVLVYDDAIELLNHLKKDFQLAVISNGNVDVKQVGIDHYFDLVYRAGPDGIAKPHQDMFVKAHDAFNINDDEFLYVGDHIVNDAQAAMNAGSYAILINEEDIDLGPRCLRYKTLSDFKADVLRYLKF